MTIQKLLDLMEDTVHVIDSCTVSWSVKGVGFGQFVIYTDDEDGKIHISNETMSREFVRKVINHLVDEAILDDEQDNSNV